MMKNIACLFGGWVVKISYNVGIEENNQTSSGSPSNEISNRIFERVVEREIYNWKNCV